ncbi:xanthine dehydrogenase family protein molybdopterin-binding subunit [Anaerosporomusa subterranea]|nr:xanthine dehydrogenase family protein molybdopterin-binding subunit [Anaerosporomusa subterranea]
MGEFSAIGKSIFRKDAVEKVTGSVKFVDDLHFGPNTLIVKVLRSPHAHALIKSVDVSKAEALPGVRAVVTGKEYPNQTGLYLADRTVYAVDRVRFVGEPVAAVAAVDVATAEEAIGLIKVEYELLPGVFDPVSGAKEAAVQVHEQPSRTDQWWQGLSCIKTSVSDNPSLLHENLCGYTCAPFIFPVPGTNISNHFKLRKGKIEDGFASADIIVENAYAIPHIQHVPIEPHAAVAYTDQTGKVTLWVSSQSPNAVRKMIATAFDLPMNKLRVIAPPVGGGFGGKAGLTCEALVVPLAMKLPGYYCKLTLTREEVFQCTFVRQGLVARIKTGATAEGKLVAQEAELFWDGGAYTEYGVNITRSGGYCASGPYEVPNIKVDSYCVYTNHPVGGPMRGFGMPEIHWGIEQQMDILAEKIGIDPLQFRQINAIREGRPAAFGGPMPDATLPDTLDAIAKTHWELPKPTPTAPHKVVGRGLASMFKAPSMPPNAQSSAIIKFNEDATVHVLTTAVDIGQGALTALAQIAAEELGIPVDWVTVLTPDTDYTPYEWQTVASRITYSCGNAVKRAASDAKQQLLALGSVIFGVAVDLVDIKEGFIFSKFNPANKLPLSDIVMGYLMPNGAVGGPVIGRGAFIPSGLTGLDRETGQGERPAVFFTFGTQAADIEVDTLTGEIKVLKVSAAYEVGKVVNPALCKAQVQGGIVQGLSSALYENLVLKEGKPLNNDFVDYKIAAATDTPEMNIILLETGPQVDGPYGAKAIAEPAMVPTAPAIANALYDALGIRICELPLTADKVLAAIRKQG